MSGEVWAARNVAEYAYCPRLFYFMQVEGAFVPSSDTEKGQVVHSRVNRPSLARSSSDTSEGDDPNKPRTVRSLALTSERLGLTATLDLAEIEGDTAVPVEYRKGRPKHVYREQESGDGGAGGHVEDVADRPSVEPWPTDRVQLALQALLLEDVGGYRVERGVIYYSAEKMRLELAIDHEVRREAVRVLESAKECAKGPRPLPLVNDPRCPRCSLQPVCLPDEVNSLREDVPALRPRKIWPPRDDGIQVVAQKQGLRIGIRGMTLRLTDRDGGLVKEVPLANVDTLSLLGSVQISTQALHALADRGIPVAFLSAAGRLVAMVDPLDPVNSEVRRAQVRVFESGERQLELAKAVVSAKIANQRTLLMRNHAAVPAAVLKELAKQIRLARASQSLDELRGHEGQAAALYFAEFGSIVKGAAGDEFEARGRQRRPPPDPVNSCMSFAYSMLTRECVAALRLAHLEPTIGAYHVSRPGRPAFALDLMEPFRPLIGDSITISAFNRGELGEGHFMRTSSGCALTDAGRRAFFGLYDRRMTTLVTHPVFGYRLTYRRMLVLHARMIAAWLLGEIRSLEFLTTR
ncbi:MAG: CRISPR-associated endonuclease Cas1 [Thermoleophilia bacterium]